MAEGKIFLKENRDRIEKKYREQVMGLPQVFADIHKKLAECTDEVALACKYLYAFMPYSDIGNYAFEVFLDYAENGVQLWKENPQVAALPEEIFLNYVLFHRVNEEEIAPCRTFFRTEIGTRTQGMDFKEAAQLINIIKPKFAIPVHYGSVVGSKQDATDFIKLLYPTIKGINLINQ